MHSLVNFIRGFITELFPKSVVEPLLDKGKIVAEKYSVVEQSGENLTEWHYKKWLTLKLINWSIQLPIFIQISRILLSRDT